MTLKDLWLNTEETLLSAVLLVLIKQFIWYFIIQKQNLHQYLFSDVSQISDGKKTIAFFGVSIQSLREKLNQKCALLIPEQHIYSAATNASQQPTKIVVSGVKKGTSQDDFKSCPRQAASHRRKYVCVKVHSVVTEKWQML